MACHLPYDTDLLGFGRFYTPVSGHDVPGSMTSVTLTGSLDEHLCEITMTRDALSVRVQQRPVCDQPIEPLSALRNLCLDAYHSTDMPKQHPYLSGRLDDIESRWRMLRPEQVAQAVLAPKGPWTISPQERAIIATMPLEATDYSDKNFTNAVSNFIYRLPPQFGCNVGVTYNTPETTIHASLVLDDHQEAFLNALPPNRRFVLEHRYGLNGCQPEKTYTKLGLLLRVSGSRAAQLDHDARSKLRRLTVAARRTENIFSNVSPIDE